MSKTVLKNLILAFMLFSAAGQACAAELVLRLHHFLPPDAAIPHDVLAPWAEAVERDSGGRIDIELYPAMQLGGKPADLVRQLREGYADIVWTVMGYTPGEFPRAEAFELPFMTGSAAPASMAFFEYSGKFMQEELSACHVLAVHVHGPGLIHSVPDVKISSVESMEGLMLRSATTSTGMLLEKTGANGVAMAIPSVPRALDDGLVSAITAPWEILPDLGLIEKTPNHTEFSGNRGLYTATFLFAMNRDVWDRMPDDLRAVIDRHSGMDLARIFGKAMDERDIRARTMAQTAGNSFIRLDAAETARWKEAGLAVNRDWVTRMQARGIDGAALILQAVSLLGKYDISQ